MELYELKKNINDSFQKISSYGGYFDIENKKNEINKLENEMLDSNFWNNQENSSRVINKLNSLKSVVGDISSLNNEINDLSVMVSDEVDLDTQKLIEDEYIELNEKLNNLELLLLLNGSYDRNDCILEIHAGAGGTEACDWAMMIYRMYQRWCDKKGYKYELVDFQEGDETGVKSVSLVVKGLYSYGYLKCEKGIHRLVRLSPFDANHKRHTSFASVLVTPILEDDINIEISPDDLKIDVYRSSGNGGQGVNTTDSAVRITHIPSRIVVTCQNERSQLQNKEHAMKILKNKLRLIEIEKKENELNEIKGEQKNIEFGSQIRSYVMHPYSMVKDHRTKWETSDVNAVLNGEIDKFIEAKLREDVNEV
ncbi:MAG: peptide chain release factor 2 [Bacilli bacterium]|nr:peptide chain release factor 2 [Bacilli bacterium]